MRTLSPLALLVFATMAVSAAPALACDDRTPCPVVEPAAQQAAQAPAQSTSAEDASAQAGQPVGTPLRLGEFSASKRHAKLKHGHRAKTRTASSSWRHRHGRHGYTRNAKSTKETKPTQEAADQSDQQPADTASKPQRPAIAEAKPETGPAQNAPGQFSNQSQIGNVQIVSADQVNTIDMAADAVPLVSPKDLNTIDLAAAQTAPAAAAPAASTLAAMAPARPATIAVKGNRETTGSGGTPAAATVASASQPETPENPTWLRRILFTFGGAFAAASAFRIFLV